MPLPKREYFTLKEVSDRWNTSRERVCHYVETGKLTCSIWLRQTPIEMGQLKKQHNGKEVFQPEFEVWVKGFVGVSPEDCRMVFRDGEVNVLSFVSIRQKGYFLQFKKEKPDFCIKQQDLIVLRDEVERFEKTWLVQSSRPPDDNILPLNQIFTHSDNYQTVTIRNKRFRFGMIQANVIQQLHEASKTKQPWIHGKILLDKAGSRCQQLKNLFSSKPDWRKCIESDGRGYYRLNI